eukprot:GHVS01033914.1.p1 GENE.GHVS01033914.1~~GHVS01033914.1.p1  ORF type:complete len:238 (+),score=16.77 GHVS01033914.1:51-764(+)
MRYKQQLYSVHQQVASVAAVLILSAAVPVWAFVDPQNTTEAAIQLVTTGLTNVFMFLPVYKSIQTCHYIEGTLGMFAFLTSTVYHILQTLEPVVMPIDPNTQQRVPLLFLGGNSLEWHQADNIFGISSFCMVVLQMAQVEHPLFSLWLRLFIFCFNATSQCLCPWDERYTVYPILATLGLVLVYLLQQRRMPLLLLDHCCEPAPISTKLCFRLFVICVCSLCVCVSDWGDIHFYKGS